MLSDWEEYSKPGRGKPARDWSALLAKLAETGKPVAVQPNGVSTEPVAALKAAQAAIESAGAKATASIKRSKSTGLYTVILAPLA